MATLVHDEKAEAHHKTHHESTQEAPITLDRPYQLAGASRGHLSVDTTPNVNDTSWGILYGALINNLGLSPSSFQLVYPMTSWNWPTNNPGFTTSQQYDFCATIPQWSATGSYVSSGATFDSSYQQFLNCIQVTTTNPTLQQQIIAARNQLTQDSGTLQTVAAQAQATYNSSVTGNNPTYTAWLGTPAGLGYAAQINTLTLQVNQDQAVLNQLLTQQTTPGLSNAQTAFANQNYYTKLSDQTNFPAVPNYNVDISAAAWVSQVQGGGGTGASFSFANAQSSYDYSKTWAAGSSSVGGWFWSVYASGSWQQCTQFSADSSLTCTVSFKAWDTINITPAKWYSGTKLFANGPYIPGYTANAPAQYAYMFGQGGVVPLLKTGMLVCYQPTITITVSQSTYQSFQQQWSAAGGIQVGPFQIGGSSGGQTMNWSSTSSGMQCVITSTSTVPLIFGTLIAVEPQ
jgi:hypothetical protein